MAKTHYLGATMHTQKGHQPGELKINKPMDQLTAGELDLMLIRQKLEIQQQLAEQKGIGYVGNYDEVIATINHCLANVKNPDAICAIGEALENGASLKEAIDGIGKTKAERKEARAQKKKETGKTAAGRLLQKVGKRIKAGAKAVVKVATAPLRLVAKGAMEIYLPKAAPFFLYLWAPNPDTLPDAMKRKRKKAEKFKNFVVKAIGMKDDHFMKIVSNGFLKRFGKEPAAYLADKLQNRISGIGNPKSHWRKETDVIISGIGKTGKKVTRKQAKKKPNLQPKAKEGYNTTLQTPLPTEAEQQKFNLEPDKLLEAGEKLSSGNVIGAAIQAISWLISKISSLFKGEKMEPITADDFPDVERDAANVFDYQDMSEDYSNLNVKEKTEVKDVAAEMTATKIKGEKLLELLEQKLQFLNPKQRKEVANEVEEGWEAMDEWEGRRLAKDVEEYEPTGDMAEEKTLDNVTVTAKRKAVKENDNTLPLLALGIAVVALSK